MTMQSRKPQKNLSVRQPGRETDEMQRYFEDVFGRTLPVGWRRAATEDLVWAPSIEVVEKADKFLVKVELPGVSEEDINISLAGNTLTVKGEKETESEVDENGYYYTESSYGSFSRSMTIPSTIDASKIEANCDKGILEITLPKTPEVKPKKIKVVAKKKEETAGKKKETTTAQK
jgi:HSP20 family protein